MEKGKDGFGDEIKIFNAIVQRAKRVGAGKDFFRRLAFTDGALEAAVAEVDKFDDPEKPASLKTARQILGRDKVISAAQVAKIWATPLVDNRTPIRYQESTLRQCAEDNEAGHDWRLLYVFGRTLHELVNMQFDADVDSLFSDDWWLEGEEAFWANEVTKKRAVDNYLLIDFSPVSAKVSVTLDNRAFVLDVKCCRWPCSADLFAEAVLTVWLSSGEELALSWEHWGGCVKYPDQTQAHIFVSMDGGDRGVYIKKEAAVVGEKSVGLAFFEQWDF